MALSLLHQMLFAVSLGLCVFVVLPRLFGGVGDGRSTRESPGLGRFSPYHRAKGNIGSGRQNLGHQKSKTYENIQQVQNSLEQKIKKEKTKGSLKGFTFTLMPLYAIGVGVFAAYKYVKVLQVSVCVLFTGEAGHETLARELGKNWRKSEKRFWDQSILRNGGLYTTRVLKCLTSIGAA